MAFPQHNSLENKELWVCGKHLPSSNWTLVADQEVKLRRREELAILLRIAVALDGGSLTGALQS